MDDLITLHLPGDRSAFAPGETLSGSVSWQLAQPATAIEVRLFWYTRGKGTTDVHVLKAQHFDAPGPRGSRSFQFLLPPEPYSFSGKLISLLWAIEAIAQPGDRSTRADLVISPTLQEILLTTAPAPESR